MTTTLLTQQAARITSSRRAATDWGWGEALRRPQLQSASPDWAVLKALYGITAFDAPPPLRRFPQALPFGPP
jgi:hypothetical protein